MLCLGKAINIEYGNIKKKKGNIESMLSKIENGNGPPMGWGGVTADDDRGCYDPVDPVWPPIWPIEFDVTVFDVPVFDVNCLYPLFKKLQNFLTSQFSNFIYSK